MLVVKNNRPIRINILDLKYKFCTFVWFRLAVSVLVFFKAEFSTASGLTMRPVSVLLTNILARSDYREMWRRTRSIICYDFAFASCDGTVSIVLFSNVWEQRDDVEYFSAAIGWWSSSCLAAGSCEKSGRSKKSEECLWERWITLWESRFFYQNTKNHTTELKGKMSGRSRESYKSTCVDLLTYTWK
jgi:hypothetical protein